MLMKDTYHQTQDIRINMYRSVHDVYLYKIMLKDVFLFTYKILK